MSAGHGASLPGDAAARLIEQVESLRRSQPEQAWEALAASFPVALRGATASRRGELWRLRGHVLRAVSRLAPAAQAYRRAEAWYRRAGDAREEGRCAIGLVDTLMYLGRYREAERVAARGHRALARSGDRGAEARLLNNEGNLYHRLDRPDRALDRYRRARAFLIRAGDRRGAGMVEGNIANCFSLLGRTSEARRLYRGAKRTSAAEGFAVDALNADYNLAYLDFLEHRHERALDEMETVRERADSGGVTSIVALTSLDRAEILLRLGDHDRALEEATAAAAAFAGVGMVYERAKADVFAALAEFRLGRPAAARSRLERALEAFLAEGNAVWAGEALVGLATLWWSQGSPAAAGPLLAAAARRFAWAADHEREGCARALMARARLEAGRPGAAAVLARARALARRRRSARLSHLVWVAEADLARRRGDRARARGFLVRAARESERLAARILDEQWRASFWGDWGWPHQELAALEAEGGRIEAAFEALERGRGRALASSWRSRGSTRQVRQWAAGRLARDRGRSTRSAPLEGAPEAAAAPSLRRALAVPVAPLIVARAVRSQLPRDSVMVDFALHRGDWSAFILEKHATQLAAGLVSEPELTRVSHDLLFELRRAALEPRTERAVSPALSTALAEMASLVLWPALERAGVVPPRLAVIPSGPLGRLPWAALPLPDGRPLCAVAELVVVPGLRLGMTRRRVRGGGRPLVVAAGAEGLDNVPLEAEAVRAALDGAVVLAGKEATAERFMSLAPRAPWVHFAGHGLYQAGRSGLRLHDRWVLAEELNGIELSARAVVLSACQTARALVRPGEEWFGLPRGLLLAGTEAVLAAQWDVDDEAAARFMSEVYGRLAVGMGLARAVAATQQRLAAAKAHPLDWAGFVVLGGPGAASGADAPNALSRARSA